MTETRYDPERLLLVLAKQGVRSVVIGGVAATLHGSAMVTADLDIAYERTRENLARLAAALEEIGARLRGIEDDLPFKPDARALEAGQNFTFVTRLGNLDCLGWTEGVASYEDLAERAVPMTIGRATVLVASLEDLIAMKRAAGRPKDRLAVMELEEIGRMRGHEDT